MELKLEKSNNDGLPPNARCLGEDKDQITWQQGLVLPQEPVLPQQRQRQQRQEQMLEPNLCLMELQRLPSQALGLV